MNTKTENFANELFLTGKQLLKDSLVTWEELSEIFDELKEELRKEYIKHCNEK